MSTTSSSPPSSSSASSSPIPSQNQDDNDQSRSRNPSTSNLYLVTFLATLFLLLFVSCAIVLRSYILRRRFQRRIDEAMSAGIMLAPTTPGSRKKRFGPRPRFFDTWISPGGCSWTSIMPLSVQTIFVKRRIKDQPSPLLATNEDSPLPPPSASTNVASNFLSRFIDTSSMSNSTPPPPEKPPRPRTEMLQVAVLIAMPSPPPTSKSKQIETVEHDDSDDEDEDNLPEVVIGISRLHFKASTLQ